MLPNFAALDKEPDVLVVKRAIEILTQQALTCQSVRCCDIYTDPQEGKIQYKTIQYDVI